MQAHDIESESLEAHVSICQERYQALERRFDSLESRIDRLEVLITDIHNDIENINKHNNNQWDRAKDVIIGLLFASSAWLASQVFLAV